MNVGREKEEKKIGMLIIFHPFISKNAGVLSVMLFQVISIYKISKRCSNVNIWIWTTAVACSKGGGGGKGTSLGENSPHLRGYSWREMVGHWNAGEQSGQSTDQKKNKKKTSELASLPEIVIEWKESS